jgi:sugar O-acyltransferase (sialic acid O-acetyltransferase NeuD family)
VGDAVRDALGEDGPVTRWLLFACRTSYAAEVAEIIWRTDGVIAGLVDNLPDGPRESSLGPVCAPAALDDDLRALPTVVPLLTPGHRYVVEAEARRCGIGRFPPLVDATAVVARTATLGEGSVVNAATVVGANTSIGRFVHVNRSASLAHDNDIDEYASIGPGCVLAGGVRIARGAFLGAGAVCAPDVTVGANAVVGAGAVVVRNVPEGAVVFGNPARVMSERGAGYGGVSVPRS